MGIPGLFGLWLSKLPYDGLIKKLHIVEGISFDMNGLLHSQAQAIYSYGNGMTKERNDYIKDKTEEQLETEYKKAVVDKLAEIITKTYPRQYAFFCVDGPAPRAKINQQRSRRYRPMSNPPSPRLFMFDSTCITPGTEFMKRLDVFINNWIRVNREALPPYVVYSPHSYFGEGEHKMFKYLKNLMNEGKINQGTGNHIVYGLDADLIMLSSLSSVKKILLCRENDNLDQNVDMDVLIDGIHRDLTVNMPIKPNKEVISLDLVTMIFLIGNDFLPHIPSLEGIDVAMKEMFRVYKTLNKPLTIITNKVGSINWVNMSQFIDLLSKSEENLLRNRATVYYDYPFEMLLKYVTRKENPPKYNQPITYNVLDLNYNGFRKEWYQNALKLSQNLQQDSSIMCMYYLKTMDWILSYYQGLDITKFYAYPYLFSPLLTDLASVSSNVNVNFDVMKTINEPDIRIIYQLLSVLPARSSYMIPVPFNTLLINGGNLSDLCPIKFDSFFTGKNKKNEHEAIPILPPADINRVIKEVNYMEIMYGALKDLKAEEFILYKGPRMMLEFRKKPQQPKKPPPKRIELPERLRRKEKVETNLAVRYDWNNLIM